MKKQSNQAPDEATLTLWMDGELDGDKLMRVESWAQEHPEILAQRDAVRAMNASIRDHVPASVEPPYADFFNQRILRHIHEESAARTTRGQSGSFQHLGSQLARWLAFPVAACAMLACFYLGTRVSDEPGQTAPMVAISAKPSIYVPDEDVKAAIFSSDDAEATVIVLEGLEDIPDDFEIVGEPWRSRSNRHGAVLVSSEIVF